MVQPHNARQLMELPLLSGEDMLQALAVPGNLSAQAITLGRKPRIERDGETWAVKLNNDTTLALKDRAALDSLADLVSIPKSLIRTTPERLVIPLVEYHLGQMEKVVAITDDLGIIQVEHPKDLKPAMKAEDVLAHIAERFPQVLYQRGEANQKDHRVDLLAITHDQPHKLEDFLAQGGHHSLPDGGDPFRAGIHVRFSPLGIVPPMVEPYLVRLICTNGAIHQEFITEWGGRGFGEGDELWQWFRDGMNQAADSIDTVMHQYAHMVGEALPEGQERLLAVEGMIRAARLPRAMATALRDQAIIDPPRTMYGAWNLLTRVATHHSADLNEQVRRMSTAGNLAQPTQHHQFCPTCRRG